MKDVPVLILSPLPPFVQGAIEESFTALKAFEEPDRDGYLREVGDAVRGIAIGGHVPVDGPLYDRLPKLEIVSSIGVGYDHIDAVEAGRRGVIVTNTPDVLTDEVADLTIGLLIATLRHIPQVDRYLRQGRWLEAHYPLTATLRGRKIGILALGRIGRAIARRLEGFGVEIAYHGRTRQPDVPYAYHPTLLGLAEAVDVLISVAPGGSATKGIIDAAVFRALGPTGVFINVGRGSVVDEPALVAALRDGTILSAGLDVYADEPRVPPELIAMDHVVLLPHVGSASVETRRAMGQLMVDNLLSWFSGRGALTPVPETPVRAG